jgi:WD40 repeat protein
LTLFISHSSRDNAVAIKVRDWLRANGWSRIFLDLDPEHGLAPGHKWKDELKKAGERCSGVVLLISPDWIESSWCQAELALAEHFGKRIFPVLVASTPLADVPRELRSNYQFADISDPAGEAEGFRRFGIGLKRAGLDPSSFPWPPEGDPHRAIYRGMQVMEEVDAAVFFGRDALVTKGLDALRQMRGGMRERMMVILGASGAGKSSFLRAGLTARLRRDEENFLVPPVIRPERAALSGPTGLARSLGMPPQSLTGPEAFLAALERLRGAESERLIRFARAGHESPPAVPPTIVLAIDQAEELFTADNAEAARALEFFAAAAGEDRNMVIVATIRSDSFDRIQAEPRLTDVPRLLFDLPALPLGAFKEVIEGPARLADPPLAIDPALSEHLLHDIATADALPLLALTLERLAAHHRESGRLTLADYAEGLGGLQGAVRANVEAAFTAAARDPTLPAGRARLEELCRAAFIPWLVQLDDADAEPKRRLERLDSLPEPARPLIRHLVDQRLLVSDRRTIGEDAAEVIEVVHEAVLRQWPALRAWIGEERDALRDLDAVRAAAAEWNLHREGESGDRGSVWLAHRGHRLADAEALTVHAGFAGAIGPIEREYLAACRAAEDARRARELDEIARTRRLQSRIGRLIALAAVLLVLGAIGIGGLLAGLAQRTAATLTSLASAAADAGNYDGAARYALAALTVAGVPFTGYDSSVAEAELRGALYANAAAAVLHGHKDIVFTARFSADGTRIVTASADDMARVWDVAGAREILTLRGHTARVFSAQFSADGTRIVTGSADGTARIWDSASGRELVVLHGRGGFVTSAAFSPDGNRVVASYDDASAVIWNADSGAAIATLSGHALYVRQAEFSPDGRRIATASDDGTVRLWDGVSGEPVAVLRGHADHVRAIAFSPDGSHLASASDDRTARIWDTATGHETAVLRRHLEPVMGIAFTPDGTQIATASADSAVHLWDAATGGEVAVLRGHGESVLSVAFSRDGNLLATGSKDQTARIWRVGPEERIRVLRGHAGWVLGAAFSPDGRTVVTGSSDGTARIWDAASGKPLRTVAGDQGEIEGVVFSPDGARIAAAGDDGTARVWDIDTGREELRLTGHKAVVTRVAFNPDGTRIVTSSDDRTARLWDSATGQELVRLIGHQGWVNGAAFAPDGRRVATSSSDGTLRLWDAADGHEIGRIGDHPQGGIGTVSWSPDGTRLLSAIDFQSAKVWDIARNAEVLALSGHKDRVYDAAFSPDGSRIVTTSDDRTSRLWDAVSGRVIAVLHGHTARVYHAAFSPDGKRVVTVSHDRTARFWRLDGVLQLPRDALEAHACSIDLAHGLQHFTADELRAAPVLDPAIEADPCRPPSIWARLRRTFWKDRP